MRFTERTVGVAYDRQIRKRHCGADCACCGKNLWPSWGKPIPIEPNGGWKVNNCAIVCDECFDKLGGFDHPSPIPLSQLPYVNLFGRGA
jgi:hypothetical protein